MGRGFCGSAELLGLFGPRGDIIENEGTSSAMSAVDRAVEVQADYASAESARKTERICRV
jgi:hypothetical protein